MYKKSIKSLAVLLLYIVVFTLSACGQTGPLYLPGDKPAQQSSKLP